MFRSSNFLVFQPLQHAQQTIHTSSQILVWLWPQIFNCSDSSRSTRQLPQSLKLSDNNNKPLNLSIALGKKNYHFACSCTGSVPLFMVWNLLLAIVLPCQYLVILDPPPPTPLTQTHRADQIKIIIRSIQQKGYGICDQLMYLTFYQRNENVGEPWPDSSIYIYIYVNHKMMWAC